MPRKVAIVGAGYVGVPLAQVFSEAGNDVLLVDISPERVARINTGDSYIEDVPSPALKALIESGRLRASTDYDELKNYEAILVALPTPLSKQREPDLTIVMSAVEQISSRLQPGQMVVLESTTYPGTTRDKLRPVLEEGSGLTVGKDFFLGFSPERVDPGREDFTTKTTPKVVGGLDGASTKKIAELYRTAIDTVIEVSSPESAEMTKLLENIFRSVNIALVNELAQLCDRMGLDVWEIIEAAASKPFGFMKFAPGPGLGGHCIPIDPFYLTWKAREHNFSTEFIELAGKINESMPYFCRGKIMRALNSQSKPIRGSKILVLGVAYKKDISDMRESPALKVIKLLIQLGAVVSYHDPFVAELPEFELKSVELKPEDYDCVTVVTDHSLIDYEDVVARAQLVVDFRNVTKAQAPREGKVWKL